MEDPYRMYLVVRRGAFEDLETGCVLAGAAAVKCVRRFAADPEWAEAVASWKARPGKVALRARGGQWDDLLRDEALEYAGDLDGAAVVALPPRRRSERSELLARKLQAFASDLAPLPTIDDPPRPADDPPTMTYIVNPALEMSTGKTMAQVAHAATMAAATGQVEAWVEAGCPGRVVVPKAKAVFDHACRGPRLASKVEDAGLTEVPPGTITVLGLPAASPTPG